MDIPNAGSGLEELAMIALHGLANTKAPSSSPPVLPPLRAPQLRAMIAPRILIAPKKEFTPAEELAAAGLFPMHNQNFKLEPRYYKAAMSSGAGLMPIDPISGSPSLEAPSTMPRENIGSPLNLDPKGFQFLPPPLAFDHNTLLAGAQESTRKSKKRGAGEGALPDAKRPKIVVGPPSTAAQAATATVRSKKSKKKKKKRKTGKALDVISYPEDTIFDVTKLPALKLRCPYCTFTAPKTKELYKHINEHNKKMVCPTCTKKSTCMGMFVYHCRTHTGEKPYKCPIPGCKFSSAIKCNLKIHLESALHGDDGARTLRIFGPVLDMDSNLKNNTPGASRHRRIRKKKKKLLPPPDLMWPAPGMGMQNLDPEVMRSLFQNTGLPFRLPVPQPLGQRSQHSRK